MDWQFKFGVGLAVFFGLLNFALKDLPYWVSYPGVGLGMAFMAWGLYSKLRPGIKKDTIQNSVQLSFGDSGIYKVVNRSVGQSSEIVHTVLRSKETIFEPKFVINILASAIHEANTYVLIESIPRIIPGNDVPIAIAQLGIIEGSLSDIMLQRVSPSGRLDPIRLGASDYKLQLIVSKNSTVFGQAYCRLWIDRGTLRLTTLS
jgi:hypothetical protein